MPAFRGQLSQAAVALQQWQVSADGLLLHLMAMV